MAQAAGVEYPSAWECDSSRFNWYCDEQEQQAAEKAEQEATAPKKTEEDKAFEELKQLRETMEKKKALAIMKPTPENMKSYIAAQEAVMDRSSYFSDQWRRVIWQNPELNYQLRNPINNSAIPVQKLARDEAQEKTMKNLAKEWGIFFFFKSDCPFCHKMAPILKYVAERYGITVFPISLDGKGLPEFPNPQTNNGMAQRLDIKQVPTLYLGNIKDRRLMPLSSGVVSANDIVERIYVLTQTKPGELY